jgi:hypothetical protein
LFLKLKEILKQKNEELAPILAKVKQELEKEREEVITVKPCEWVMTVVLPLVLDETSCLKFKRYAKGYSIKKSIVGRDYLNSGHEMVICTEDFNYRFDNMLGKARDILIL